MATFESHPHGNPNWIDLMAKDGEAAAKWYGALFGWTAERQPTPEDRPYWMFKYEGHNVAGMGQMSPEMQATGMPPVWNSYFATDDVDASVAKATELGGAVMFPPMDIPHSGRMAFVTDPEGAAIGLWQDKGHCGSTIANVTNTWCWSEHDAKDLSTATEFYADLFGWDVQDSEGGIKMYFNKGKEIAHAMQIAPEWGEMPAMWAVYFTVDDVEEAVERVTASGGEVLVPGMDISVGRFALVKDPQGGMFYLFKFGDQSE